MRRTALALVAVAVAAPAAAQLPMGSRALGMGGAYLPLARGQEAVFLNPANLGLSDNPAWSISLPQLGAGASLLGPGFADLSAARDFDGLSGERRAEILAAIPEEGAEVRLEARAPVFSLSNRHFALGVGYGMTGEHSLGKDLVELLFDGYEEGRTDYSVGRTEGSRATYFDVVAAFGRKVGPVSLGVAGHYYRAGTLMRSRLFEPRFDLAAQDFEMQYVGVHARGGNGYGVDVGAAVQPSRSLTLSAAVANVASRMTWSEALRARSVTVTRADLDNPDALVSLLTEYRSGEETVDPAAASLEVVEAARGLYEQAYFPAQLRLGAAWRPVGATDVAVSYEKKLTDGRLSGRWEQTASVGVQQRLVGSRWRGISLRAGYASDLEESRALSGGLSLGPLQVGVAKLTDRAENGAARTGWMATFGLVAAGHVRR